MYIYIYTFFVLATKFAIASLSKSLEQKNSKPKISTISINLTFLIFNLPDWRSQSIAWTGGGGWVGYLPPYFRRCLEQDISYTTYRIYPVWLEDSKMQLLKPWKFLFHVRLPMVFSASASIHATHHPDQSRPPDQFMIPSHSFSSSCERGNKWDMLP